MFIEYQRTSEAGKKVASIETNSFETNSLVSIIIPTYNSGKYLKDAVNSALNQTYKHIEIIIIDDGSTDNTREIVSSFNSEKIKYIYQPNSGTPANPRNRGIRESCGKYITFCDADDILTSTKIERQVYLLNRVPHLGLVFTDFINFDHLKGTYNHSFLYSYKIFQNIKKDNLDQNNYIINSCNAFETLFYENYIGTPSVIIPRDVLVHVGEMDESLRSCEDRDLWFRITKDYNIGFIDTIGFHRRILKDSVMHKGSGHNENRIRVIRKHMANLDSKDTIRQAHKQISRCLSEIAYQYKKNKNWREARRTYLLSLKEYFLWHSLKGLIISSLGLLRHRLQMPTCRKI